MQPSNQATNKQSNSYSIAIAGSTDHTRMCAEALLKDPRFHICWILTPSPRLVGRKQELVKNPMHLFGEQHNIPVIFVESKLDQRTREQIGSLRENKETNQPSNQETDFLLVVDFGYFIPNWLLELPTIAPINVHPSELPKYRGSSPGQFTLLYGERHSAVSVIIMNDKLDEGDLIYQDKFAVLNTWTADEYYQFSFEQISEKLPNILTDFALKKITAQPQPLESSTPIARRLNREDGFVEWDMLQNAMNADLKSQIQFSSPLLNEVCNDIRDVPKVIEQAVRALSPWPGVWTIVETTKGSKRMKILSSELDGEKLKLIEVQIEGQQRSIFSQIQNLLR